MGKSRFIVVHMEKMQVMIIIIALLSQRMSQCNCNATFTYPWIVLDQNENEKSYGKSKYRLASPGSSESQRSWVQGETHLDTS